MKSISLLFITVLFISLSFPACSQKAETESEPTLDEKIGQMLLIGFRGFSVDEDSPIVQDIEKYHLGGVVLFDYDVPRDTARRNIESPEQVEKLVSDVKSYAETPLIVAIDQEGGKVAWLKPDYGFKSTVSAQYLGELNDADSTRHYARETAQMLRELGINTNLAPVVDVNINPENPIIGDIERSFSEDPEIVTKHAKIYIETMREHDILTSLKHFPGHGSSEDDSHLGVVDVTEQWQEKELDPYRNLIEDGFADIIMTAHIFNANLDANYPATLSKPTITGLLRDSLGYDGVVKSDDLQMEAIREEYSLEETIQQSLNAGVDILVFGNNTVFDEEIASKAHRTIKELVETGAIPESRIDDSYQRIRELKGDLNK